MIRRGYSLLEVCIRLGHKSVDTTQKYLSLDLSVKKERIDELVRFTEQLRPTSPDIKPVAIKTTDEMVRFLKSV